jgi:hypothetical protein
MGPIIQNTNFRGVALELNKFPSLKNSLQVGLSNESDHFLVNINHFPIHHMQIVFHEVFEKKFGFYLLDGLHVTSGVDPEDQSTQPLKTWVPLDEVPLVEMVQEYKVLDDRDV